MLVLFPYGNMQRRSSQVRTAEEIGTLVRKQRKRLALTQRELGELAGVGTRFISDLENGKATAELGRVLHLLEVLGVHLHVEYVEHVDGEASS